MTYNQTLEFYTKQWKRTQVNNGTFDNFPNDIWEICKSIQNLLIHPWMTNRYWLRFSQERINDRWTKSVQESINRIKEISNQNLLTKRKPEEKIVNICKHFAMFLCSILREKWIPARCRCGFAIYFENGWFDDHWICEYYDRIKQEWIMVDAQLSEEQVKQCHINTNNINPLNLPKWSFIPWWVLWKLYRNWLLDWNLCWFSLEEWEKWERYIRWNMLRDFFALNKTEYTYSETSKLMKKDYTPNNDELLLLDEIASLTINIDNQFEEYQIFLNKNKQLSA